MKKYVSDYLNKGIKGHFNYEFSEHELTSKAFAVYSDSSFTFWTDEDGTFYRSDNPYSEKVECGTIEDVNEFLEIFA